MYKANPDLTGFLQTALIFVHRVPEFHIASVHSMFEWPAIVDRRQSTTHLPKPIPNKDSDALYIIHRKLAAVHNDIPRSFE